jgi:hypothetical protein
MRQVQEFLESDPSLASKYMTLTGNLAMFDNICFQQQDQSKDIFLHDRHQDRQIHLSQATSKMSDIGDQNVVLGNRANLLFVETCV